MQAFRISHDREVEIWVRKLAVDFTNWYLNRVGVEHQIKIYLRACGELSTPVGLGIACFNSYGPRIWIATWWPYWCEDGIIQDQADAYEIILDSLAHELVHYEKWSRGIPNNHRGLQPRVDRLLREFNAA